MKKQLVSFNESGFNILKDTAKKCIPGVQDFVDGYEAINGASMTPDLLKNVMYEDGCKAKDAIIAETLRQIDESGIKSKGLINAAIQSDEEEFESLLFKFSKPTYEKASLITIENGKVVLSKEATAAAKENFCHYITTERGAAKKEQYEAFLQAANNFFDDNKLFRGALNMLQFFNLDNNNKFSATQLDYDRM